MAYSASSLATTLIGVPTPNVENQLGYAFANSMVLILEKIKQEKEKIMKAKVRNGLIVAMSFVLVLTLAFMLTFSLGELSIASAEDTALPEETTYLTGIRSSTANTIYAYWRLDGADLGNPSATGIAVDWYAEGSSTPTTKYVKLSYTTVSAQNKLNTGSTILRANAVYTRSDGETVIYDDTILKTNAPAIKIDWFNDEACTSAFAAVTGDTFTLANGTSFSSASVKYVLDQDYTFTFGGANNTWALSDDTHIPVSFDGARSGSATDIYVYGSKLFNNYIYSSNTIYNGSNSQGYTTLNSDVTVDYYASDSAEVAEVKAEIQVQWLSTEGGTPGYTSCLRINLKSAAAVGSHFVLKKGTMFDNYVVDRDYTFTQYATTGRWYMTAGTTESDPEMTLTTRGNNLKNGTGIYLFTTSELPFSADERFAKWTPIDVNGSLVYINYMGGLAKSGNSYSFYIKFHSAVAEGSLVTLPKGMYIAGYRLAKTHYIKYVDSTTGWIFVECDGTNHMFDDEFTCHDRICACGHVEVATTEHISPSDKEVCEARNCTDCGEAITPADHTFAQGTFVCQDRTCTVCNNLIKAESAHTPDSDACDAKCIYCQESFGNHEFATAPEGGWTVDSEGVTVTTEPNCTTVGAGTIKCANCDATTEVVVNALGHDVPADGTHCSRCDYRIPFTADDMDEILALESLTKYNYGDSKPVDDGSVFGQLRRPDGAAGYDNNFIINAYEDEEGNPHYVEGKEDLHNMLFSFSLNLTDWATASRQSYVWLGAHENGAWGIGFMFNLNSGAQNVRIIYKSDDSGYNTFANPVTLSGFELNKVQKFQFGLVQNSDGSLFAFGYYNGKLIVSGTLSADAISKGNANNHYGLGGALSVVFNGSTGGPSPVGTICNLEHDIALGDDAEQFACKDYNCSICNAPIAGTEDHKWGAGVSNNDGTCDHKETFTHTCSTCNSTDVREGDFVHAWGDEPVIVTPAVCGGIEAKGYYACGKCDAHSETADIAGSADALPSQCELEEYVITAPTCNEEGEMGFKCKHCGLVDEESGTEPIEVDNTAHVYGNEIPAQLPTSCSDNGVEAHYECSVCGKLFVKDGDNFVEVALADLTIPADHTYGDLIQEVPATCTTNGVAAHYACSACDKLFTKSGDVYTEVEADDLVILAAHTYAPVAEVPSTCVEAGVAAHFECSVCDKLFTKAGDVYTEVALADLALELGAHNHVNGICSVCDDRDEVYFFNAKIDAVNAATTAEGKFNAIKEAVAQFANLTSDEQSANEAKLASVFNAYNQMAQSANDAHNAQSDIFADLLKLLAEVAAMASLLAVGLYLAKF